MYTKCLPAGLIAIATVVALPARVAAESSWRGSGVVATRHSPAAALHDVPIRAVTVEEGFWHRRMDANLRAGLPKLLQRMEEAGVIDNFRRLSGRKSCARRGPLYTDSDVYKWIEGAALALQSGENPGLQSSMEAVIDEVLAAQQPDGYLNSYYVEERAAKRFSKLGSDHELYCAGHLFQAAVAHHRLAGSRKLLDGAVRFADYLVATFGPGKKIQGHCGHPEIEMSLVELYRTTGDRKYLELARYYLEDYGFTKEKVVHDHAVRMMYVGCGGTDYYAETGESPWLGTAVRLWSDLVGGKMYITGGVGSRHGGEAIGDSYELPNRMAYAETCAAIGNAMWNWRLLAVQPEARYADEMERALYNGVISGVSLEGSDWFYVNPLEYTGADLKTRRGGNRRQPWFDTTCCPSNMVRTLAALPGYLFSTSEKGVYLHLYDNCRLDWHLADGTALTLVEKTGYPWNGQVRIEVTPEKPVEFELALRVPGWCPSAKLEVNGKAAEIVLSPGTYARVSQKWQAGDVVLLELAMPVKAVVADERLTENRGRLALQRGPIVYCLEGLDNPGVALDRVCLKLAPAETSSPAGGVSAAAVPFTVAEEPNLLDGIAVLKGEGVELVPEDGPLYRPLKPPAVKGRKVKLTAIPYYAWANREPAAMAVWLRYVWEH